MAERNAQELAALLQAAAEAHDRGDRMAARAGYEAVLAQAPDQADALHLLGVVADQEGRHGEAIDLIRRAIARSPQAAAFHVSLGNALTGLGRTGEAAAAYEQALGIDPACLDARVNLGNLRAGQGADAVAEKHYLMALRAMPKWLPAHIGISRLLLKRQQPERAVHHLSLAVGSDPAAAEVRDLLATALRALARHPEAVMQHRKAIALAPDEPRYRENLAITLIAIETPQSHAEAVEEFEAVLARHPDRLESLIGLGAMQVRLQRPQAALAVLDRARQQAPDRYELLVNYSSALALAGRMDEALSVCDRLVALFPDHCGVLTHRATTREHAGDYAGALEDYDRALQAQHGQTPEGVAETEFKRVLLLLSFGRLGEAWPLYRARLKVRGSDPRGEAFAARLPAWDGIVRPGQRLLVWGEQGIGDQILFGGMLPALVQAGVDFTFGCDPRLVPLFERSMPGLRVAPVSVPVDMAQIGQLAAAADVQAGLGDIGALLRRDLGAAPAPAAWLRPDPARVAQLRARYAAHGKRHIVGITWRSSNPRVGGLKSAALADWLPVLRQADTLFVDMQYGDTAEERQRMLQQHGIAVLHDDTIDAMQDLDGFAAQAAALDMLVGCSNSGIHIAAAAGTPCRVLVPSGLGRLWYWHLGRDDSPWYPHVRLFRQPPGVAGDWQAAIAALAASMPEGGAG